MNEAQRQYFRDKLLSWRDEILLEAKETIQRLQEESITIPTRRTTQSRKPAAQSISELATANES